MSDYAVTVGLMIVVSMFAGWVLAALVMWMVAEWDERKWRKRMEEIQREGLDRV